MAMAGGMRGRGRAGRGGAIRHGPPGRRSCALAVAIALGAACIGCRASESAGDGMFLEREAAPGLSLAQSAEWAHAQAGVRFDPRTGALATAARPRKAPGAEAELTSFGGAEEEEPGVLPEEAPKRLRIYAAHLELLVAAVEDSVERFVRRVEEVGGFLEKREDASVTCRVPAIQFKEILAEVKAYGLVVRESLRATDVTKQYFDLKIRIENAEKTRERLVALLDRAEKVEDALRIETELRRLAEEIDRLKGELKYLSEQIAFSTIEVVFQTNAPPPRAMPARKRSRFDWIHRVGVEHVLEEF